MKEMQVKTESGWRGNRWLEDTRLAWASGAGSLHRPTRASALRSLLGEAWYASINRSTADWELHFAAELLRYSKWLWNGIKRHSRIGVHRTWATGRSCEPSILHSVPTLYVSATAVSSSCLGRCSGISFLTSVCWGCQRSRSGFQSGSFQKARSVGEPAAHKGV